MQPRLARIAIYPIKSLDPLPLEAADFWPAGALAHDRRFMIRDSEGNAVNAKRTAAIHRLWAQFDPARRLVRVAERGGPEQSFQIDQQRHELHTWLSEFFGHAVTFEEDTTHGFPDDLEAPGPTVVSTATLEAVAAWFPDLSLDEMRLRFRANLEIDGVDAFWEDRLYAAAGQTVHFALGPVVLAGTNPCQRCVVPTRDPANGEIVPGFAKTFAERRAETLPGWAERSRFNHFYRLTVNTRLVAAGGPVRIGDALTIVGVR